MTIADCVYGQHGLGWCGHGVVVCMSLDTLASIISLGCDIYWRALRYRDHGFLRLLKMMS